MRLFANIDHVIDSLNTRLIQARRDRARWEEALRNGGRLDGAQGKQSQRNCLHKIGIYAGQEEAYFEAIRSIESIDRATLEQVAPRIAAMWPEEVPAT